MPLDPSIIMSTKPLDIGGAIANGMTMANLAQQTQLHNLQAQQAQREFADQTAMRNASANNTKIDANGNVSLDRVGTLKDLAQTAPHLVPQAQQNFATMDFQLQKQHLEKAQEQHSFIAQLASGTHDQSSWDSALQQAGAAGLDTSQIPKQFDPGIRNTIINQSLTAKDYLSNQIAQQEANTKQQTSQNEAHKLDLELRKYGSQNVQETLQSLQSARGNPAVQKAENDIYSAKKANTLAALYPDPNKMPQQMVNLYVSELGKIAQGGSPTVEELHGLTPDTLNGKLSSVYSKLKNEPTSANAGEFIKQYQKYANSVAQDAKDTLKENYQGIIETKKPYLPPSSYKTLNDQFMGRLNGSVAPGGQWSISEGADSGNKSGTNTNQKNPGKGSTKTQIHPALVGKTRDELLKMKAEMEQANAK